MAKFFIDRPVFSWVIAILIMLAGILSIQKLPQARLPRLAPPVITMSVVYDGANAETVQDSVTQIIEQNMSGVDDLLYMSSSSSAEGRMLMRLTFDPRVNVDTAQMQVQNRLQRALRNLPDSVNRAGVLVRKVSDSYLQRIAFFDRSGQLQRDEIADFVSSVLMDPLTRVPGVGDASLYAAPYAMRIWIDPHRLLSYSLTPRDVINAIKSQNEQIAVGQIGGLPSIAGQGLNVTLIARERLKNIEQFENIIIKSKSDGSAVRVKDVANVAMGEQSYMQIGRYKGMPSVSVGIQLNDGANAVETAKNVDEFLNRMQPLFPHGLEYTKPYDTVPFIKVSIKNVAKTLTEAVILVSLTILIFLQNFRATLIPTLAVPVVLLGTFAIMSLLGFSINTLTMFGLILAIGLLVDDAVVVVENTERLIITERLSPYDAVCKTMNQVTGALIGVAAVLSAVFIPMAFFGGMVGGIYRQFSVTIVSAMLLSVIIAITFTPPLCANLLKAKSNIKSNTGIFGIFNKGIDEITNKYHFAVLRIIKKPFVFILIYIVILVLTFICAKYLPTGFLPVEDQGSITINIFMPPGSTRESTFKVVKDVEKYFEEHEKELIDGVLINLGAGPNGSRGQNVAQGFVDLKHWELRTKKGQDARSIALRARSHFASYTAARLTFTLPPEVPGLGQSTGISLQLQDLSGIGHEAFVNARETLIKNANQAPELLNVRTPALDDIQQLRIELDDLKIAMLGLNIDDVNVNLATAWGGNYVNDFIDRTRIKRVYVQGEAKFRMNPDQLKLWHFRNSQNEMIPLDAFSKLRWTYGPAQLERYNGFPSVLIEASVPDGGSSGDAMDAMESAIEQLPSGLGFEWTGLSYQEKISGQQTKFLYTISLLIVFLSLAALYESWSIPIAVMLVVPIGALGAFAFTLFRGLVNDIYFQVGLLAVVGLSAKNAILIVEFARNLHRSGMNLLDATAEAAKIRLRPILMTSIAFLIGVIPLTISSGAGANSQHSIGTGIVGGTFMATVLGIFFIPLFFVIVTKIFNHHHQLSKALEK